MSTNTVQEVTVESKTRLLAKALGCQVIEDVGYRGIIYSAEHQHLRYHISHGLQRVVRVGETWRSTETVLTREDIAKFLSDAGLKKSKNPINTQVFQKLEEIGAKPLERFAAGGGILEVGQGLCFIRYSPILGVDLVEKALSKWVSRRKVFFQSDLTATVRDHGWSAVQQAVREAIQSYRREKVA